MFTSRYVFRVYFDHLNSRVCDNELLFADDRNDFIKLAHCFNYDISPIIFVGCKRHYFALELMILNMFQVISFLYFVVTIW